MDNAGIAGSPFCQLFHRTPRPCSRHHVETPMPRTRSVGLMAAAAAVLAGGSLLLHACADEPPTTSVQSAARGTPNHYQLTLADGGSTASGTVTSNRGGINCVFTYSGGRVTLSGTCTQKYRPGANVTLTAAPAGGAVLAQWAGCNVTSDNPLACQGPVDSDILVKPTFAPPANS